MPENYTPAAAATGTWTEEEIRHQASRMDPFTHQHRRATFRAQ